MTNNTRFNQRKFYNCAHFLFGSPCQYTFDLKQSIELFGDFVISLFNQRSFVSSNEKSYTCYQHLSECYSGPESMSLDWREICDEKIDCIGDHFGIDEDHCEENEYRCHNGAQCIPLAFYHDGFIIKDCLDGTNEEDRKSLDVRFNKNDFTCLKSILYLLVKKKFVDLQNYFHVVMGNAFTLQH